MYMHVKSELCACMLRADCVLHIKNDKTKIAVGKRFRVAQEYVFRITQGISWFKNPPQDSH